MTFFKNIMQLQTSVKELQKMTLDEKDDLNHELENTLGVRIIAIP